MMIDFGQQRSSNEQEITALFLSYLPLEPLPVELAKRLKAQVLLEVKGSLKRHSITLAPFPLTRKNLAQIRLWYRPIIIIISILILLAGLLYINQFFS